MPVKKALLKPRSTETADGDTTGNPFYVGDYDKAIIFINVFNVGGTSPTLDVYIVTKDWYSGNWFVIGSYKGITATGQYPIVIESGLGEWIAVVWKLGGTSPSFEFSVSAILKR